MAEGPEMTGEFVFVPAVWLGGLIMGTDHGWPSESAEPGQDRGCGSSAQLVSWTKGAVHAVAAAISRVISVPAILLECIITLAVSVASPTGGLTLMAHGPVHGSDHNTGTAGMCTVWSSVDCCSSTFPAISQ